MERFTSKESINAAPAPLSFGEGLGERLMKTKHNHFRVILLLAVAAACFAGCKQNLPEIENLPETGGELSVTVSDNGYATGTATRAKEEGYQTVFTDRDQIGIFAVKNGEIIPSVNNLPLYYKESEAQWVTRWYYPTPVPNVPGAVYYAYYPYRRKLKGELNPAADNAAAFFAAVIAAWEPAADQSDHKKYTAQDLMIARSSAQAKKLDFRMQHVMALAEIRLPMLEYTLEGEVDNNRYTCHVDVTFDGFTPWHAENGAYRYLVNPTKTNIILAGSYTVSTTSWSVTFKQPEAGNRHFFKIHGDVIYRNHNLQQGDYFLKNGSLISKDEQLTEQQRAACIGIVFSVADRKVIALHDAGTSKWGEADGVAGGYNPRAPRGANGWRLPTLDEARKMYFSISMLNAISPLFTPMAGHYWTSNQPYSNIDMSSPYWPIEQVHTPPNPYAHFIFPVRSVLTF